MKLKTSFRNFGTLRSRIVRAWLYYGKDPWKIHRRGGEGGSSGYGLDYGQNL